MSKKKSKAQPIDRAAPVLKKPKTTDVEKVETTRSTALAMAQSPSWAAATDVQGAVASWSKNADDIDANAKVIIGLEDQLATAMSKQRSLRRSWRVSTGQVLSTVNVFCAGSANLIKGFSLDVRLHAFIGALPAPEGLVVSAGVLPGDALGAWTRGSANHGFVVQHATDPGNAATYSAIVPCTKTKYTLGGSPSGSIVHLRVAAVDPTSSTGIGPWSAWAAGTAK